MADPQNGNQSLALQGRFGGFPQGGYLPTGFEPLWPGGIGIGIGYG